MVGEMSGVSKKQIVPSLHHICHKYGNGLGARRKLPERVALTWIAVTEFRESLSRLVVMSCPTFGHYFLRKMVNARTKGDALR
jgi:hypothetical protein